MKLTARSLIPASGASSRSSSPRRSAAAPSPPGRSPQPPRRPRRARPRQGSRIAAARSAAGRSGRSRRRWRRRAPRSRRARAPVRVLGRRRAGAGELRGRRADQREDGARALASSTSTSRPILYMPRWRETASIATGLGVDPELLGGDPQHSHVALHVALAIEQRRVGALAGVKRLDVVGQLASTYSAASLPDSARIRRWGRSRALPPREGSGTGRRARPRHGCLH